MAEYVKYQGIDTMIGTLANLYYTTYPQYSAALRSHTLTQAEHNLPPEAYAKPDSGFRFRFPFPDEDHLPIGSADYNASRGIPIMLSHNIIEPPPHASLKNGFFPMEIRQQKLVHRTADQRLCLALVLCNPVDYKTYSIDHEDTIRKIFAQIITRHVQPEKNDETKAFFQTLADRILNGYLMQVPRHAVEKKNRVQPTGTGHRTIYPQKSAGNHRKPSYGTRRQGFS